MIVKEKKQRKPATLARYFQRQSYPVSPNLLHPSNMRLTEASAWTGRATRRYRNKKPEHD